MTQPWVRSQWDRRASCWCGHRYGDHGYGGAACVATVADDSVTGNWGKGTCSCKEWHPWEPRLRKSL